MPVVSIITPVYNGGKYLAECIESVITQTYSDWRYDIVDNRSTDDTRAIAERYASVDSRIHVHAASEFVPVVASFNRAMTYLAPESLFCKPLAADDRLLPECLEKMVAAAAARPQVGLVCCVWTTASGGPAFGRFPPAKEAVTYMRGRAAARLAFLEERHYFGSPFFGSPTITLIRADLVRARTPSFYDEDNTHPDFEVCFDVLRESDFAWVEDPLVFVRVHEDTVSSQLEGMESIIAGRLYTLTRYGRDFLDDDEYRFCLTRCQRRYYDRLAVAALRLSGPRVWNYHRMMLRRSGLRLERRRVAAAIVPNLVRSLRTPRTFLRAVSRRIQRRRSMRPARGTGLEKAR
jgi:glycosyltransferase involved in cell wall biosynthesis